MKKEAAEQSFAVNLLAVAQAQHQEVWPPGGVCLSPLSKEAR